MAVNQVTQDGLKDLNINRFRSVINDGGTLAKACRYIVAIKPQQTIRSFPKELHYLCEAAEFPGRGFSVVQTRYYGPSQMYPVNSEYQPINLTFMCRSDSRERRFFDDWLDLINPVDNFNFEYPEKYYCTIELYQYAEYGLQGTATPTPLITYQWRLNKAWPTLVSPQAVGWAEQDYLRMSVSFAYKYWDRPNLQ